MSNPKSIRSSSYVYKRYIWLVSVLYANKRLSYAEIVEKWENSVLNDSKSAGFPKRTFHDHLEAIADIFGVIIKNEGCGDFKYYIENAEDLEGDDVKKWLLDCFSANAALYESSCIKDRIIIQDVPSARHWLLNIITAIREKKVLEVEYVSFQKGKIPTLYLCPLFVKQYENRWYVYARRKEEDKMKQYALDRITGLVALDETFDFEPSENERFDVENCFGHVIDDRIQPETIRIQATVQAAAYLETLPLHKSQKMIARNEESVIYEYYFAPTAEFYATLRKWGKQLQLLPKEIN